MNDKLETLTGNTAKHPFFKFYGQLSQQQNMLQDLVRTGTYHEAVHGNPDDFLNKKVMDVGTGSGVLAIFAAHAGAEQVYAVEASPSAETATKLIKNNNLEGKVKVIKKKVEDISENEIDKVDLIISEPMGFILLHERMLESFIYAREKFLKVGGRMYPSTGTMMFLPFTDHNLIKEQRRKSEFFKSDKFFDINMNSLYSDALKETFSQSIVGTVDIKTAISSVLYPASFKIDFEKDSIEALKIIRIPFDFEINSAAVLHGFFGWFDVDFLGSNRTVTLSTSPERNTTHWYQCRFLLNNFIGVNVGQRISGSFIFTANEEFSYDVDIHVELVGSNPLISSQQRIYLQDQQFLFNYTSEPDNSKQTPEQMV